MYSLIAETDKFTTRKRISLPRQRSLYPSEASVILKEDSGILKPDGQCLRQTYYRLTGEKPDVSHDAYTEWIFATGKGVEVILIELWKQMGILVENNVKFYDEERNISGEMDAIIRGSDGELYVLEVKSFAGYLASKEIMGNAHQQGHPKLHQMLQTLLYVDLGKRLKLFECGKMIYYARDSGDRREFDITLTEDDGVLRPTVDGVIDYRFTMQDIYDRYAQVQMCYENKILPPRDYSIKWNDQEIEEGFLSGEVSKTKYDKWKKSPDKNPVGSWRCSYCAWKKTCYKGG